MELEKSLPFILSSIAIGISFYTYLKSSAIANANLELNIYNMVRNSKVALMDATKQMITLEDDKKKKYEIANKLYETLVEDLVTAYEEACTKYLDNKVDKRRFEKNFKTDIQNLLNDEDVNKIVKFGTPKARTEYGAILKVYSLWFDKEK